MNDLRRQPLDIVTACRQKDLSTLIVAAKNLRQFVPFKQLHVYTAQSNFPLFARKLGADIDLIDEDAAIPGMTLEQLRQLQEPGFPQGAGWYFQQLLKFSFAFRNVEDDHYLIWDADTVPLRPLEFFDENGRLFFTAASENHQPYFETYRHLLGHEANREFSFISQHCIVRKSILREMLQLVERNIPGEENWAWKIIRNLRGEGSNRFSEFETYGHYMKNVHPDAAAFRELPWLREGSQLASDPPSQADLDRLKIEFAFVSFEAKQRGLRKFAAQMRRWLPLSGIPSWRR